MTRIVLAVVLGGALYFIFREIMKYKSGISGTRSAAIKDLLELEEIVDGYELAPWHLEEIDLISRNYEVQTKSELHAFVDYGCFLSIYEEPIMAYATKEYKNNERRLIVLRFNQSTYHFNILGSKVEMTQGGKAIGQVSLDSGLEIDLRGNRAQIDTSDVVGLIPLSLDKKEILGIATDDEQAGHTGRMLKKLNDYDEKDGELILLSISFALANKQI